MAVFNKVRPPTKKSITMGRFLGIDLRNAPSNVEAGRSPYCPNMIRDTVGSAKKRYGYKTLFSIDPPFNGGHTLKDISAGTEKVLVHGGKKIYSVDMTDFTTTELTADANDGISKSVQISGSLYILDGANYWTYDGTTLEKVSANAYIPTIIISRLYDGGGTVLEPVNLIQPKRIERFLGDNTNKTFQLTATNIDLDEVTVKSLQNDGTFSDLVENTDFTVNRALGTVTFGSIKPTPVTGEDNLYITYAKTITGYSDRVEKCDIMKLYGINGQRDTLVIAGHPELVNYDWHSKADDPTYFGDTWYSVIGQDDSRIVGYSILNDRLITHKDSTVSDSTIVRAFEYVSNTLILRVQGSYQATGALAKHSFASFDNEPLYVTTSRNISAITASDILGERFSQERSYYISSALEKESDLENAYGIRFEDYYMLAVNGKIYILDSIQPVYERNAPYSNRQYECYLWTGIGARVLWVHNEMLFFGTTDGDVKRFFTDNDTSENKYLDDDENFDCWFDTNEIYGSEPELKKMFTHLAVLLASYPRTGVKIWAKVEGIWEVFFDYDQSANFIDFNDIDFSEFTFRTDDTPTLAGGKMKLKRVLHTQLRFENSKDEPFGIYLAVLKYTSSGEYIK